MAVIEETVGEAVDLSTAIARAIGGTMTEGAWLSDAQITPHVAEAILASDSMTFTVTTKVLPHVTMLQDIAMTDTAATQWTYYLELASAFGVSLQAKYADAVETLETIQITPTTQLSQLARIIDTLQLTGLVLPATTFGTTLVQAMQLSDQLQRFFGGDLLDTISVEAVPLGTYRAISTATDGVTLTETVARQFITRVTVADGVDVTPEQVLHWIYRPEISEAVEIGALYLSPGSGATTWAMNSLTGAVTEYTNYAFNSFAEMGGAYLGAADDGLYELQGDDDAGTDIIAKIRGGLMQFAGSRFASFRGVYLGMRGAGDWVLKIESGNGLIYTYAVTALDMDTTKVHMGKGLRARYFSFELTSTGQDFDIDTIEFVPIMNTRRV